MTENADVEWLRESLKVRDMLPADRFFDMELSTARRLLAHIDQLEVEVQKCRDFFTQIPPAPEPRPTVREIAVQMMAAYVSGQQYDHPEADRAKWSYDDAEALVAEGRRRDGSR